MARLGVEKGMSGSGLSLSKVTTLAERKRQEAMRRKRAADEAVRELHAYAGKHGGRFVVFGSYVTASMRFDSDLDVLVDFPPDQTAEAWLFAEDICSRHAIPLDIHDARTASDAFAERVMSKGLILP